MATIKAPFNFVPLSDKIFFPDWADQISQDIPFSDGLSGTIELKITAETPIFVRNGHTKEDAEAKNDTYKSFSKTPDGKYFIPGTSIKGAIRNVLEIISFGKIGAVANQSFGIRDLSNGVDGQFYRNKIKPEKVHCGWLSSLDDKFFLDDCGIPWRISAEEIDRKLGIRLDDFVKKGDFKNDFNRAAKAKYDLMGDESLTSSFSPDEELRSILKVGNRLFVRFSDEGEKGTIVFTGQPGNRKIGNKTAKNGKEIWKGKYYEFVFPSKVEKRFEIPSVTYKEFISIHKDSPDYLNLWKKKLQDGEKIPVFIVLSSDGKSVEAMGLSYMFKYPAFNTIYSALRKEDLDNDRMDLAECVFGRMDKRNSLKGRVQFGHAICTTDNPKILDERLLVLSNPHPSYYPLYLGNGQTWNSEHVRIAGIKRYPVRNNLSDTTKGTSDMETLLVPLDTNTSFKEKIRFHNLRRVELGALLSSITFGNDDSCRHSFGSGKPYGYGKSKVEITNLNLVDKNDTVEELISYFDGEMEKFQDNKAISELKSMAKGISQEREQEFTYMQMSTKREDNEFIKGKEQYSKGEQLGTFSQIVKRNVPNAKFIGNVAAGKQRENIEAILERQKEKKERYDECMVEANLHWTDNNLEAAKQSLEKARQYTVSTNEIDDLYEKIRQKESEVMEQDKQEQQKRQAEEAARHRQAQIEGGLIFLEEKNLKGEYKVVDFKGAKNRIEQWLKKSDSSSISEGQDDILAETLRRVYMSIKKDRERQLWTTCNEGVWKYIVKWTSESRAKQIYDQIIE